MAADVDNVVVARRAGAGTGRPRQAMERGDVRLRAREDPQRGAERAPGGRRRAGGALVHGDNTLPTTELATAQ